MTEGSEITTFPVAETEVRFAIPLQVILLRLAFLSHETQRLEEADPGRTYVLSKAQAEYLVSTISDALRRLESGDASSDGMPTH